MKCVIVDDDPIARELIRKCIERCEGLELVSEFGSAITASNELASLECDLVFLDIEMPEMNGIEFMRENPEVGQVVVVSGKSEYAAEAFDYNVTDYLVKPVDYDRFCQAVEKVRDIEANFSRKKGALDHVFVKKAGKLVKIELASIHYIEALSDYITIHSDGGKYTLLSTMKSVEAKLGQEDFLRIHRSYIVRYDRIKELQDNTVLVNESALPVSRSYKSALMNRLRTL